MKIAPRRPLPKEPSTNSFSYRADIDGLRALAILSVVLFHLNAPGFGSGYAGVDIFFVISGYLITTIILKEMQESRFSFTSFYERRIRRLFPALFLMLCTSTIVATLILLPDDMREFSKSMVAATTFSANFLFWRQVGYFNHEAAEKPLLHTWSLSVEEQFYIVFPLLLFLLLRYVPRRSVQILFVLFLLSLAATFLPGRVIHPSSIFYLPAFRAWELLLGCLLALQLLPFQLTHTQRQFISAIGIFLILFACSGAISAPSLQYQTVICACLGTALIIFSGNGSQTLFINRALAWKPFVFLGLISYSLYLWHWPIIGFAKYYFIRDLEPLDKLLIFILSIVLATASWRFVERPFRGNNGLLARSGLFGFAILFMLVFISFGIVGYFTHGLPQRLPAEIVAKLNPVVDYPIVFRQGGNRRPKVIYAVGNQKHMSPNFLVWGDSHAEVMLEMIDQVARQNSQSGYLVAYSGCRPLLGVRQCANSAKKFIEKHPSIKIVFLVAKWGGDANTSGIGALQKQTATPSRQHKVRERFRQGLQNTIQFLLERNIRVIFVHDVPEMGWDVGSVMLRSEWYGRAQSFKPLARSAYEKRRQPVKETLAELGEMDFEVFDTAQLFCSSTECAVEQNGIPLYSDDHHINNYGANRFSSLFAKALSHVE